MDSGYGTFAIRYKLFEIELFIFKRMPLDFLLQQHHAITTVLSISNGNCGDLMVSNRRNDFLFLALLQSFLLHTQRAFTIVLPKLLLVKDIHSPSFTFVFYNMNRTVVNTSIRTECYGYLPSPQQIQSHQTRYRTSKHMKFVQQIRAKQARPL